MTSARLSDTTNTSCPKSLSSSLTPKDINKLPSNPIQLRPRRPLPAFLADGGYDKFRRGRILAQLKNVVIRAAGFGFVLPIPSRSIPSLFLLKYPYQHPLEAAHQKTRLHQTDDDQNQIERQANVNAFINAVKVHHRRVKIDCLYHNQVGVCH